MKIVYFLEDTALFGGVKIALQQAEMLAQLGNEVVVVSKAQKPSWFPLHVEFRRVPAFDPVFVPTGDVAVATFWTTIPQVMRLPWGQKVHYCQGLEFSYTHNLHEHESIRKAYSSMLPAMVLAPHLGEVVAREFHRPVRLVPPPLSSCFRPRLWRRRPFAPPRILVVHPFENDWKGVRCGLEAVKILRQRGVSCALVRLSQWPLSEAERKVLVPDHFYSALTERQVARLMRACDLLLAPSWEQEGFGLPVLEAMGSGVPVVASDIAAFRFVAAGAAILVPPHDPEAFADAAEKVLRDLRQWQRLSEAGLERAKAFHPQLIAPQVENALKWVASGDWARDVMSGQKTALRPEG